MKRGLAIGLVALAAPMCAQQAEAPRTVEIHVDQRCRIVEQNDDDPSQLNFRDDPEVCRLAARHDTRQWQGNPGSEVLFSVHEQDYLLTDTTDGPVTFVVAQFLPDGWAVDSDPQPTAIEGGTAIFRVDAVRGQTIRLHVGVRKQLSPDPDSNTTPFPQGPGSRPPASLPPPVRPGAQPPLTLPPVRGSSDPV